MSRGLNLGGRESRLLYLAIALVTVWCVSLPARVAAQTDRVDFEAAARAAPRLRPAAFPELPASFAAALQASGCTVPQYRFEGDTLGNNVISGEFARAGQLDHAALCSRDGQTSVVVIWGGPARCADTVKPGLDVDAMVGAGDEIVYTRQVRRVARREAENYAWLRAGGLADIGHDGILHSVGEYQTSFLYCRGGAWIEIEPEATT
ncbi:hypothetical protein [Longimicrobium terrae]|uniref:Uncharacterized protein n=1 Tax=Longimicrobium terrae TaxID=1639882 RepID=A0A841GS41_9BACT|nr:hypothetical protein [Longimicrobium terrae]MBB4635636.1 hypothetical protein [Longimicrobium terrae]MBB6070030.1 hypothetical protein [Longimicrobium terrae]NNC32937.1 hypothetical protein [Longimicrobium terrae]